MGGGEGVSWRREVAFGLLDTHPQSKSSFTLFGNVCGVRVVVLSLQVLGWEERKGGPGSLPLIPDLSEPLQLT